jgi:integrase/recombinase XerD
MMDYLQDFLDFTQYVRGRSANTIQSYRYDLSQFLEWVKVKPLPLQYVLFNRGGKPLNTRQAFRIIRDIGIKAGIKNLYPHLLRHTFAVNLRRKGGDTMLLKEALGHSSIITTQIYCGFTNGEFKEKMRQLVN